MELVAITDAEYDRAMRGNRKPDLPYSLHDTGKDPSVNITRRTPLRPTTVEGDKVRTIRNPDALVKDPEGWHRHGKQRKRVDHSRRPRTKAAVRGSSVVKVTNMYHPEAKPRYFKQGKGKGSPKQGSTRNNDAARNAQHERDTRKLDLLRKAGNNSDVD